MRTTNMTYSELKDKTRKLAKLAGKDYYSNQVETRVSKSIITKTWEEKNEYNAYIDGYGWHVGHTPHEAFSKLYAEVAKRADII